MDSINSGADKVYVLATTNMPWELDIAALRRFERRILLPMPEKAARHEIFKFNLQDHPNALNGEDLDVLAGLTNGYSGSDISTVINEALMKPVRSIGVKGFFKVLHYNEITDEYQKPTC